MKVLIINGSPRTNSNSSLLVSHMKEVFSSYGVEVDEIGSFAVITL